MNASVLISVRIDTNLADAFDVFVTRIDEWWVPDPLFQITPRGDGCLAFDPGIDGCLYTMLANGKRFEIGKILEWAPPTRLAFTWRQATFDPSLQTRVEVDFETIDDATRVTVKHSGWTTIPQAHVARHGYPDQITQIRAGEWWQRSLHTMRKFGPAR